MNYSELKQRLKDFLENQTREDIEQWLKMDRERMAKNQKDSPPEIQEVINRRFWDLI